MCLKQLAGYVISHDGNMLRGIVYCNASLLSVTEYRWGWIRKNTFGNCLVRHLLTHMPKMLNVLGSSILLSFSLCCDVLRLDLVSIDMMVCLSDVGVLQCSKDTIATVCWFLAENDYNMLINQHMPLCHLRSLRSDECECCLDCTGGV